MLSFVQATGALDELIDRDQDFRLLGTGYGFRGEAGLEHAGQLPGVQRCTWRPGWR